MTVVEPFARSSAVRDARLRFNDTGLSAPVLALSTCGTLVSLPAGGVRTVIGGSYMGILGDLEGAASDVVHAGEDVVGAGVHAVEDVAGMLSSLHNFLTDAGLGNVVRELEQLANQANQLKQELAAAASSAQWLRQRQVKRPFLNGSWCAAADKIGTYCFAIAL